jgi:ankyrin repeat protein
MMGNVEKVKMLIAAGVDPNGRFNLGAARDVTPLRFACMFSMGETEDRVEIVRLLIAAGADVDEANQGMSLLHHAVTYAGHPAIIEPLVAAGHDVDAKNRYGRTPLHGAGTLARLNGQKH